MSGLTSSSLLAFALTCTLIELTPGPNMAYLATLSLASGARAGIAAVAGVALGLSVYGLAAAFGLAAAIERSHLLYETLRWAGVAYLFWLAWESWSAEREVAPDALADVDRAARAAFRRGLVTNLLNPKAAVFYIAVVPSFIASETHVIGQTLLLSGIFVAIATTIHLVIVLLASRLHGMLTDPARRKALRRIFAVALAAIAVWFAFSTAR
ncbi:MAG: LysE family translocator [Xanthobacteraceae bacterium]|nr:LysE family translocator [Xanthobacteraceae bacterium]